MRLTKEEKKKIVEIVNKRKRTKKDEWWARHFAGMPQGWKELDEDEDE